MKMNRNEISREELMRLIQQELGLLKSLMKSDKQRYKNLPE